MFIETHIDRLMHENNHSTICPYSSVFEWYIYFFVVQNQINIKIGRWYKISPFCTISSFDTTLSRHLVSNEAKPVGKHALGILYHSNITNPHSQIFFFFSAWGWHWRRWDAWNVCMSGWFAKVTLNGSFECVCHRKCAARSWITESC